MPYRLGEIVTDTAVETMKRISASSPFNGAVQRPTTNDDYGALVDAASPESVQCLERELTAALYALWRAQGVKKKIVKIT